MGGKKSVIRLYVSVYYTLTIFESQNKSKLFVKKIYNPLYKPQIVCFTIS